MKILRRIIGSIDEPPWVERIVRKLLIIQTLPEMADIKAFCSLVDYLTDLPQAYGAIDETLNEIERIFQDIVTGSDKSKELDLAGAVRYISSKSDRDTDYRWKML